MSAAATSELLMRSKKAERSTLEYSQTNIRSDMLMRMVITRDMMFTLQKESVRTWELKSIMFRQKLPTELSI